jgi:hypothetical protein
MSKQEGPVYSSLTDKICGYIKYTCHEYSPGVAAGRQLKTPTITVTAIMLIQNLPQTAMRTVPQLEPFIFKTITAQ